MSNLNRFIQAQNHNNNYQIALFEIKNKRKDNHWMWFIFPQIKGLGHSESAIFYSIKDLNEARDYLNHEILSNRLNEACNEILKLERKEVYSLFSDLDYLKLCSSMTLFIQVSNKDSIFQKVIDKFFDGKLDNRTLELIAKNK